MDGFCNFAQLLGLTLEIMGVIFMANAYMIVKDQSVIRMLFDALFRGPSAKMLASNVFDRSEDVLLSLQGLAFIGLGFLIQALAVIIIIIIIK